MTDAKSTAADIAAELQERFGKGPQTLEQFISSKGWKFTGRRRRGQILYGKKGRVTTLWHLRTLFEGIEKLTNLTACYFLDRLKDEGFARRLFVMEIETESSRTDSSAPNTSEVPRSE